MKLRLITVIALSCLFNCFSSNSISAKQNGTINQVNHKLSNQEYIISEAEPEDVNQEEELREIAAGFNILQQRYYNKNSYFTDKNHLLFGLDIEKYLQTGFQQREINFKMIPVGDKKQGIATIVSMTEKPYSSYIGIVQPIENSTKSILCKTFSNQSIISTQLTKISSDKLKCPNNFKVVNFTPKETSKLNSKVDEFIADIQKYKHIITEINKPQKISTLVEADKLAKQGKHLEALEKYQQSLPDIGLDFYTLFMTEEELNSIEPSLEILVRDAFLKKLEPITAALESKINRDYQEIQQEMSRFINKHQFLVNDLAVNTAININQIAISELGITLIHKYKQKSPKSEKQYKEFENIASSLSDFINEFKKKPEKINQRIPENLSSYIEKNQTTIKKIRNQLVSSEIPALGIDINWIKRGDPSEALPAYLSPVYLSNILLIDAIDKYQKGNTQAMLNSLEASWKISKSLQKQPILISQLVSIINYRKQIQVMRQMNNLPSYWQERLISLNLRESMMDGLNSEAFFFFSLINRDKNFPNTLSKKTKMIRRWFAIDNYRTTQEIHNLANQHKNNSCNIDFVGLSKDFFLKKFDNTNANPSYYDAAFISQLEKAYYLMLEAEMTQKVLQIKDNNHQTLNVNLNSNVCPDRKWVYKTLPNNKWSISLDKQPKWKSKTAKEPLSYTGTNSKSTSNISQN